MCMKRSYNLGLGGTPVKWVLACPGVFGIPPLCSECHRYPPGHRCRLSGRRFGGLMRTSLGMALMLGALAVALTACGTTQPPQSPEPDVKATYYDPPVATPPVPLAAAMLVISPEPVLMSAGGQQIAPSALTEVGEGWFVGPVAPIGEDGSVALDFVDADSDLEALLVPADELLLGIDPMACVVTASDTSVVVTATAFELITIPGVVVLTADGLVPSVLTAEPMTATDTPSLAE